MAHPSKELGLPITSRVSNVIKLLLPKTYGTLFRFYQQKNGIDVAKLLSMWMTLILPIPVLILVTGCISGALADINRQYLMNLGAAALLSPLSVGVIVDSFPITAQIVARTKFIITARKSYNQELVQVLANGVKAGRIRRRTRYDLYYPAESKYSGKCLLLFPGFLVDHTSYAHIASRLSDMGIVVAVTSMEPLRIVEPVYGDVKRLVRAATRDIRNDFGNIDLEWSYAGHSQGGYAVLSLAKDLEADKRLDNSSTKLIVWGAGNMHQLVPDISSMTKCRVLDIQGSSDAICSFPSKKELQLFMDKLPQRSVHKVIRGGNHNGFASYPCSPLFDGVRKIPLEKQHRMICDATAKFLQST